jgi:hypothetical protein
MLVLGTANLTEPMASWKAVDENAQSLQPGYKRLGTRGILAHPPLSSHDVASRANNVCITQPPATFMFGISTRFRSVEVNTEDFLFLSDATSWWTMRHVKPSKYPPGLSLDFFSKCGSSSFNLIFFLVVFPGSWFLDTDLY